MNGQRFIALRAPGEGSKVLSAARKSSTDHLRDLQNVRADTLSADDARDARGDPEILGLAPAMPVALVSPVALAEAESDTTQGAPWGLDAVGALKSPFTGAGVTVAVLDSGIDAEHEAFAGKNIVQRDFTGEGDGDLNGHGTHCAGTVFGGEVDGLRIGVAPGVDKALIGKVLNKRGGGSTDQIINGIWWAVEEGASVISMSIGFDFAGYADDLRRGGMEDKPAISVALSAYRDNVRLFEKLAELVKARASSFSNVVIIGAAGNSSRRPQYEIAAEPPATADGIISVGALRRIGEGQFGIAPFSNAGPVIAGPGVDIRSAKPGGGLTSMNGTSMATPHVAGVAALWLEQIRSENPKASIRQLEGRLTGRASLDGISAEERRNAGLGLVQAPV